ncbi:hypothetical protein [Aurantiacibacter hainanensis]|uniref:hypothetical protein n=1 Tax=Aurantiacibacter hainanensis TaxID=3076114 RepID=UPI0030C753BF
MTKKLFAAITASVALVATPVLAQTDIAQRAAAQIRDAEQIGEDDDGGTILALVAGGLIIAGAVVALSSDEEELPTSP